MVAELTVMMLMAGAPGEAPEVTGEATLKQFMGGTVTVVGQLERVSIGKGKSEWQGTGLVLDDDTVIYVTYGAPPVGWDPLVGARIRVGGLLRPSLTDSEQSLVAPHLRQPGKPKAEKRALAGLRGTRVRLSGMARDAKGGAIILVNELAIYLAGIDAWPKSVEGQSVAVGGQLVEKQYLPEATRKTKGEISQGASGKQYVLESPAWRLLREPTK